MIGGTAFFGDTSVMIIAQQKGRDTKENIVRNFGMPQPEGYRKALRLMKLAEKFGLPVLAFIDTPGAYPGVESEARHVSEAIAVNLREMAMLKVPSLAVIVGEGGSGGALGIGVTDRVLIFENSYYSVISPEGCAAILWKDRAHAAKAAAALKLNAPELSWEPLQTLGKLAGSSVMQQHARLANVHVPQLRTHDRQGRRIDEVEFHPSYHVLMHAAARAGLHGTPWSGEETRNAHVLRADATAEKD